MARREELWTVKVGKRIAKLKRTREQIAGLAALAEHARAVRIIKKRKKAAYFDKDGMSADQFDAYIAALDDVYSDVMKGRRDVERFAKDELEKWWHAQCPKCGWDGLSRDCAGGEPIADTGDFGDPLCPMCIKKDDYVVVDDYAEPDAQATIAALQARVKELEEITKVICGHCCEPMEIPSKAVLQSALTQRTAELEAAKAIQVIDLKNNNEYREQVANLHAELERVRGLIKALPKVEGEIEVKL